MPLIQPERSRRFRSTRRYVAVLQNKKGELEALRHASGEAWRG